MAAETATMTEVLLRCDPRDGNDPIEAVTRLPIVPRKGDTLEVWIQEGNQGYGTRPEFVDVETVVLCTYAPERIEVWVRCESYDLDEVRRIFEAIRENEQP